MDSEDNKRSVSLRWLYLLFGLLVLALLAWASLRTLRETPNREASVELPGKGWVTIRFQTEPFPPLPSGTVMLTFMPVNSRGVMVDLGQSLPYSIGARGSETPLQTGQALLDPSGMNYQAGVQFPVVGDYWLVLDLSSGKQVRFQLYVEPAQ